MLKATLVSALVVLSTLVFSQNEIQYCGFQELNGRFSTHEEFHEHQLELSSLAQQYRDYRTDPNRSGSPTDVLNQDCFIIPVVVHVIHQGEPYGIGSNIPNEQVHSAINKLNDSFSGITGGFDSKIRFCLAQTLTDPSLAWTDPNEPGILRHQNPFSINTTLNTGQLQDILFGGNQGPFSTDNVLNIVSVSNIEAIGVAMMPSTDQDFFNGLQADVAMAVCRHYAFGHLGDDLNPTQPFSTVPNFGFNGTLAHEVGHIFGLAHTFREGCSGMTEDNCDTAGDYVCDTPPCEVPGGFCSSGP